MFPTFATPVELLLRRITFICGAGMILSCYGTPQTKQAQQIPQRTTPILQKNTYTNKQKVIHVLVALCDNLHQSIEPVPKAIGNGQDPELNLYWGCDYGVKAFFKNKTAWKLIATIKNPEQHILERCIFKQEQFNCYMVADAYDGAYIKTAMTDFTNASAGAENKIVVWQKDTLGILGNAAMIAYVGHEGLMDVSLDSVPPKRDERKRDAIILACESKQYWNMILHKTGARPLLWTTELMCPEAYTLDAAITGWLNKETDEQIHQRASAAYSKYQNCSLKAASQLLATGY